MPPTRGSPAAAPWYGAAERRGGWTAGILPGSTSFGEDKEHRETEDMEESAYTAALGTMIKDFQRISKQSPYTNIRVVRIVITVMILLMLIFMQIYVLIQVKTFVTSPAVRTIRNSYDAFERHMYDGHVKDSGYGFSLGIKEHYDMWRFETLPGSVKEQVCLIPFSQLPYLCVILLIWSLTVAGEMRISISQIWWLCSIKTVPFADSIEKKDDDEAEVITGLPRWMKLCITTLVLIPRILVASLLLWLGCRWLASTLDFSEVLINAIALEFVITLNELLYRQLMSDRNKRELAGLKMDFSHEDGGEPTLFSYLGSAMWALAAALWVYVYVNHLQMVLPGYNWDVRKPCAPWIAERYNFWRI